MLVLTGKQNAIIEVSSEVHVAQINAFLHQPCSKDIVATDFLCIIPFAGPTQKLWQQSHVTK